ncbi:MAG TPA: hypothetical protein PLA39_09980 [Methanoculleus sp.]|nr:hypothetical protein [Methanoculleus sp.]
MSSIDNKLDKITGALSTAEKAEIAVSALTGALEEVMAGKIAIETYRSKAIPEIERIISKLHPGVRNAFSVEFFRRFCDFWIGKYLDEMHEARVWKIRFMAQGLGLQKVYAAASGAPVLPEDDLAPQIQKEAAYLMDLRTCGLWEDCGRSPPLLPEDIERLLADLPDPTT